MHFLECLCFCGTISSYLRDVTQFSEYLSEHEDCTLRQATATRIQEYMSWMRGRGKSAASVTRFLASIKSFYGFLIARGAMGNPFIFTQAARILEGQVWRVSLQERKATMLRHLDYMVQAFGDDVAMRDMRKHAVHYVKGLRGAGQAKAMINVARSREDYERALDMLDDEGAVPQIENTFEF